MDPQYINPKNLSHRSDVTVWNAVAYFAGIIPPHNLLSITEQTEQNLDGGNRHLAAAEIYKSQLLMAMIHMTDAGRYVAAFNAAGSAWLKPNCLPVQTCVGAGLQGDAYFEAKVTVAVP